MRAFGTSESKYLKGDDLLKPNGGYAEPIVTIDRVEVQTLKRDDGPDEEKYILFFVSTKQTKGLVVNVTNEETLIDLCGMPPAGNPVALSQHFAGTRVQLYFDPSVKFAGKKVGGLRLRGLPASAVQLQPPSDGTGQAGEFTEEPPPPQQEDVATTTQGDDIPF